MTDLFRLVPLRPPASAASEATVRAMPDRQPGRSTAGERDDAASLRAALDRLDLFLKSGTPPRSDAPKGFYLNVVV
jgi:hypothetical protein